MQTEKTIRAGSQWVKITRDSNARKFVFARGNAGEEQTYPFTFIPAWDDAIKHAQERMAAYQ